MYQLIDNFGQVLFGHRHRHPGQIDQQILRAAGQLRLPGDGNKPAPPPLNVRGRGAFEYDERVLDPGTPDNPAPRTLRVYRRVELEREHEQAQARLAGLRQQCEEQAAAAERIRAELARREDSLARHFRRLIGLRGGICRNGKRPE